MSRKLLAFDRCLPSVGAERNRGSPLRSSYSHPVSSSRTAPALLSRCSFVSGTSATRCASSRVVRPSVANRGVSLGYPAFCLIRAPVVSAGMLLERSPRATAPVDSAGVMLGPTRWTLPDDSHGGEAMSGLQIPASVCPNGQLPRTVDACSASVRMRSRDNQDEKEVAATGPARAGGEGACAATAARRPTTTSATAPSRCSPRCPTSTARCFFRIQVSSASESDQPRPTSPDWKFRVIPNGLVRGASTSPAGKAGRGERRRSRNLRGGSAIPACSGAACRTAWSTR